MYFLKSFLKIKTKLSTFFLLSEKCPQAIDKGYNISHNANLDIIWYVLSF